MPWNSTSPVNVPSLRTTKYVKMDTLGKIAYQSQRSVSTVMMNIDLWLLNVHTGKKLSITKDKK